MDALVVLCAGRMNYAHLPIPTSDSNATVPVNGKPVISWILDDLVRKGFRQATVVVRERDEKLQRLLRYAYATRIGLEIVPLPDGGSIVHSLAAGIDRSPQGGAARVLLGDTLITDPFMGDDLVYVGGVADARRWCVVTTRDDGQVATYADKQELPGGPFKALAGYYHFKDGDLLRASLDAVVGAGGRELSDLLRTYATRRPIHARDVVGWYDFGHIDRLVDAKRRLLRGRSFNTLQVDPVLNTITKTSAHDAKLREEVAWYLQIPERLQALTPRILAREEVEGSLRVTQEYYGYPTLADLYVYGDLEADAWDSILRHVFRIHAEFRKHRGVLSPEDVRRVYVDKTRARLAALRASAPGWARLLDAPTISIDGRSFANPLLDDRLWSRAAALADDADVAVVHGDLCFSNVLFDVTNQIIRLIDPRGSFGRPGVLGDTRYDVAKLRHSAVSLYDHVLADMFDLQEKSPGEFSRSVFTDGTPPHVGATCDRLIVEAGYDLAQIKLIEGLLFASMVPLHDGEPRRQRMMLLRGLELLDEVLS